MISSCLESKIKIDENLNFGGFGYGFSKNNWNKNNETKEYKPMEDSKIKEIILNCF